jgi:hypothetical protein
MSLLYKGKYYKRFDPVLSEISGKTVTELCFGDTIIAMKCKNKAIEWTGLDINDSFIKNAQQQRLKVQLADLTKVPQFPEADNCIICGSLYHFHQNLNALFSKMLQSAPRIIISEPIINLSAGKGIIGNLAKASATINGQKQSFRYTEETLLQALNELSKKLHFSYRIATRIEKDIIIVCDKK